MGGILNIDISTVVDIDISAVVNKTGKRSLTSDS